VINNKEKRTRDIGRGWVNKSEKGMKYLKVYFDLAQLRAIKGDSVPMVGFFQTNKSNEKDPDVIFKLATVNEKAASKPAKEEDDLDLPI